MRAPLCIALAAAAALACGSSTGRASDPIDGGASDPVGSNTDRPPSSSDRPNAGGSGGTCTCPQGQYSCGGNVSFQLDLVGGKCVAPLVVSFDPCGNTFTDLVDGVSGTYSRQGNDLVFCENGDCVTCTPVQRQP